MDGFDLENLTEAQVATLLGVDRRTIRRMLKAKAMPSFGTWDKRRFSWPKVLEWYLPYRVQVALLGGAQTCVLKPEVREIKRVATEVAVERERLRWEPKMQSLRRELSAARAELSDKRRSEWRPRRRRMR